MRAHLPRALALCGLLLPAFVYAAPVEGALDALLEAEPAVYEAARSSVELSAEELKELAEAEDWRVAAHARALSAWQSAPDLAERAWQAPPRITRAQTYRFTDSRLSVPEATAVLIERLLHGNEHPEVRAALVEVISRSTGEDDDTWARPLAERLGEDPDAPVRIAIAFAMRKAPQAIASAAVEQALADAIPEVRAEAARTVGYLQSQPELERAMIDRLDDADAQVRAAAARSLGWHEAASARPSLVELLGDRSADARLHALQALRRIDAEGLRSLPQLSALATDPDPRVARLAERIAD